MSDENLPPNPPSMLPPMRQAAPRFGTPVRDPRSMLAQQAAQEDRPQPLPPIPAGGERPRIPSSAMAPSVVAPSPLPPSVVAPSVVAPSVAAPPPQVRDPQRPVAPGDSVPAYVPAAPLTPTAGAAVERASYVIPASTVAPDPVTPEVEMKVQVTPENAGKIRDKILRSAIDNDVSDIHMTAGNPVHFRLPGRLVPAGPIWTPDELRAIIESTMNDEMKTELKVRKEVDYAYTMENTGERFRVNAYTAQHRLEAVFRLIKTEVRTLEELELPIETLQGLAQLNEGLVLVAGATGSGKSTTLAAMLNFVNRHSSKRIITVENPVEIIHKNVKSVISQREVGDDTENFAAALRSILRQNPDIILIGEIRDKETADSALQAAQTGHLVFSTVHAATAEETVKRFSTLYPAEERTNVKRALAFTLKGVIVQKLIRNVEGKKTAALEIMVATQRTTQSILADAEENAGEPLTKILEEGKVNGMNTMDQYLKDLVMKKKITVKQALTDAIHPLVLAQRLREEGIDTRMDG